MTNTVIYGDHEEGTKLQMARCMQVGSAVRGVLCADGHLGYAHPIGGVIAYEDDISISGVGFDIACGNAAERLDVKREQIAERIGSIVADISKMISFGVGRRNNEKVEHELFDDVDAWDAADIVELKAMAREQLGTVGSGNHYVDLFTDEEGFVWIGVHFGSRGLGHRSATKYLKAAGGRDGLHVDPALVSINSELGQRYIAAMELAGRYAYAGREWVVERVRKIIGAGATDHVHNHHNFAWRERHGDHDLWVVRKGATPAFPGQREFVGGSMGDDAVILEGVDSPESAKALYSTIHGAGRVMSRTEARGRYATVAQCTAEDCNFRIPYGDYENARAAAGKKPGATFTRCPAHPGGTMKKLKLRQAGRVRHDEMEQWLRHRGVLLVGGGLDEAPQVYRRLPDVLQSHAGTVRVLHTLKPFAVLMAGENEFDPYKD